MQNQSREQVLNETKRQLAPRMEAALELAFENRILIDTAAFPKVELENSEWYVPGATATPRSLTRKRRQTQQQQGPCCEFVQTAH